MAKASQYKFDATKPFFAVVGAGDIAVEKARGLVTDVQDKVTTNVDKIERDPKALAEQARNLFNTRLDELTKDAKDAQAKVEAQLKELQADAKALPGKVEAQLKDLQAELKALPGKVEAQLKELQGELKARYDEQLEQVSTFAVRGEGVVAKLRGKQAPKKAAAKKPAAKKAPAKKAPAKKAPAKKPAAKKADEPKAEEAPAEAPKAEEPKADETLVADAGETPIVDGPVPADAEAKPEEDKA